jgi:hypothetical protein
MCTIIPLARTSVRRLRSLLLGSAPTPGVGALVVALALCGNLGMSAPACTPSAATPALATGELPVTGVPRFDRLFADVHSSVLAVQEARSEEAEARGALARRLGLPDGAPVELVGARLRERTARLSQDGLTLELEFTGIDDVEGLESHPNADVAMEGEAPAAIDTESEATVAPPTATLRTPGREPQRRELRLLEAIAQAALSGATIYANMSHERWHTERLLGEVAELEARVDASFAESSDRERARAKLAEARGLLPQLNAQAREVSGAADILISLLDEAANTAPVVPGRRRAPGPVRDGAQRPAPVPAPASRPAAPRSVPSAAAPAPAAGAPTVPAAASPTPPKPSPPSSSPAGPSPVTPSPAPKASPSAPPSPAPAAPKAPAAAPQVTPISPAP